MPEIENYDVYTDRMRRSMWDKAFFMDKIPGTELVVDYGCADGSLIRFLHRMFPATEYVGFDIDRDMIALAEKSPEPHVRYAADMDGVLAAVRALGTEPGRIAVNFSSVFHEVFHYGFDRDRIRELLAALSPEYIIVRDMRYHDAEAARPVPAEVTARVRRRLPARQLADFEAAWGPISVRRNLVHLLLKYGYTENWERECAENYFSYTEEELLEVIDPAGAYEAVYDCRYTLPWCRRIVERDFGLSLGSAVTTHAAVILARRGPNLLAL